MVYRVAYACTRMRGVSWISPDTCCAVRGCALLSCALSGRLVARVRVACACVVLAVHGVVRRTSGAGSTVVEVVVEVVVAAAAGLIWPV